MHTTPNVIEKYTLNQYLKTLNKTLINGSPHLVVKARDENWLDQCLWDC